MAEKRRGAFPVVARKIIVKQLTAEMNVFKAKKKTKKKTLLTFKLAQQRYNFEQNRPCVIVKLKPKIR